MIKNINISVPCPH